MRARCSPGKHAWTQPTRWRRSTLRPLCCIVNTASPYPLRTAGTSRNGFPVLDSPSCKDATAISLPNRPLKRSATSRTFSADSTEQLSIVGDRAWRNLLHSHDVIARTVVEQHAGHLVKSTGDGILATFDGP